MSSQHLVVTSLQGGLGNQLFQYAAGLSVASELGATLAVRALKATDVDLIEYLGTDVQQVTPKMLRQVAHLAPLPLVPRTAQLLRRRWRTSRGQLQYVWLGADKAYAPRPSGIPGRVASTVLLNGFFQHPSWFEPVLLSVAGQLKEHLIRGSAAVEGRGATVISFRRGDYVRNGWDLPLSYYEAALRTLSTSEGPVWVIGDDSMFLELAGGWLREQGLEVSPLPDLGLSPITRDLVLLSAADRVVMSNSSYCWWGVVAGDVGMIERERTIVAPSRWIPLPGSDALLRPGWRTVG